MNQRLHINIYRNDDEIYNGEPLESLADSIKEAAFSDDTYLHTIVIDNSGQHATIHTREEIAISACENGPLSGDGDCKCGHHEYSRVDHDIGMGGWFLP